MNHLRISLFGTALCLLGLGFSDTAQGQTITTSPSLASGMSFQVQSGGAQAVQNLTITTSIDPTTLVVTVPAGQTWLKVNGTPSGNVVPFPNSPATLPVQVNTSGLSQGQTVQANITIAINNRPVSVNFPVSLTVGTPSLLTANPANISFSSIVGASSGVPNTVPVTVSSSGQALTYNVSVITTGGTGSWLEVSNTSGIPSNNSSPGFSVYVNPSLAGPVGTYSGTITIQSTTTGDSTTIPVTLSVTAGAALNVTPTTLNNFAFQVGSGQATFQPQTQPLSISTSSGSLNYQVTASNPTGPIQTTNWLLISPNGGLATTTPQNVNLSLSYSGVASLPSGTYGLTLNIAPTAGGGNTTTIPVTLVVSNNGLLTVNNSQLTFSLPFGSTTTQSQTVQVTSSNGSSVPYNAQSNTSWISVSPVNGTTSNNSALTITVNTTGLSVSTTPYTGIVTLTPQNGDQYSVQIGVSLTVTSQTSTVYAAPAALLFSYQTTQTPPGIQLVQLSSATSVGFSVIATQSNASNCPTSQWISVTPSQTFTPATLTVGVVTSGMTSGFCTGQIIITYNNGSSANTTVIIPVTVDIAPSPLLTITPDNSFGVITATAGSSSVLQTRISLGSTDGSPLAYSAFASTNGSPVAWLSLGNSQGTTQQYLQVLIVPTGLQVGVYTGQITISATNSAALPSGAFTIPVTLTVAANTTVAVSPPSLTFTQPQNATTTAASQTVTLTATGGTTGFTATFNPNTGGSWLRVTPSSGTATGTITASVIPGLTLSTGTYTGNIVVTFTNSATATLNIPVSLTITTAQTVTVAPNPLTFSYQLGSAAPATQTLNVTSTGGAVPVTVSATSTPAWLSVTPSSGSTPLTVTVSVTTSVLTLAQTYSGTITITPTGQNAITVPVTLTVTGVPAPQLVTISNAASGAFGVIAPGEIITIKGTNLGPTTATTFSVGPGGTLSNTLGGVQVMFDTIAGTPIYVSPTQINVIVPYEIAGRPTTNITVVYLNQSSGAIPQNVANQAPGIFTDSSNGSGQASVTNQNGTLNGPSAGLVINGTNIATTPASQGEVIAAYMTGGGQTSPASSTGTVTPTGTTLYKIPGTVTATINGVNAVVQFAGAAPGEVTGVIQVNIQVPAGVTGSALPLAITINNVTTLAGPTVAVQ